ncbi:sodium- and chloride-dependent glycine transporter 1-like isoform X2 [Tubulanus polymorphus]
MDNSQKKPKSPSKLIPQRWHRPSFTGSSHNDDSSTNSGSSSDVSDENPERAGWSGKLEFLLSCISYAVGLGNIWRFPYLCYKNGGGAFLFPYLIFLFLCGMPLFCLEVSYGQFASLSPISSWKFSPLFKGVGYGMVIISGIVCIYYNVIITWTLYYLYSSMTSVLPWSTCDNPWNTDRCALRKAPPAVNGTNATSFFNETSGNYEYSTVVGNLTGALANATNATMHLKRTSPSEEFWERHVLQITEGIDDMGNLRWQLLICLALAWVAVFLCLFKGVKSSGKVVYVTATFPYLVLTILLVRGVTLPGAIDGIKFYLIPDFEKLKNFEVWGDAAMQIFYSIGAGWGALITMASYNKFHHDCHRDAIIVPLLNSGTSVFAGFVIFSIIGFMAHETGSSIDDVVRQGPGLIFVVYPEAVAKLPISPLWAVLFFLMVFSVGLGSQFGMFETMTSAFIDEFPEQLRGKKTMIVAIVCAVEFCLGIPCIMQGGIYVLQVMDWYSSTFTLMIISFIECIIICWVYGINRFFGDIELMLGRRPFFWWKIVWCYITPLIIVFVFFTSIIQHKPVTYGEDYTYPGWAVGVGWCFASLSIIPIPLVAVVQLVINGKGTLLKRIKMTLKPAADWGPASEQYREIYQSSLSTKEKQLMMNNSDSTLDRSAQDLLDKDQKEATTMDQSIV